MLSCLSSIQKISFRALTPAFAAGAARVGVSGLSTVADNTIHLTFVDYEVSRIFFSQPK